LIVRINAVTGKLNGRRWLSLSVTEPENETEEAPKDQGADEEQACLRYSYDPNQEQTHHNYQADWMTHKEACTISPVRQNIIWVRFVIWSPDFASSTARKLS
jgi:hypothetical protein